MKKLAAVADLGAKLTKYSNLSNKRGLLLLFKILPFLAESSSLLIYFLDFFTVLLYSNYIVMILVLLARLAKNLTLLVY